MTKRILTLAFACVVCFSAATVFAQQQTTSTSTTQTATDPNTGTSYADQRTHTTENTATPDGQMQHSKVQNERNTVVNNPDGTQTTEVGKHTQSTTTINNPDGSTTEVDAQTHASGKSTVPQQ